MSPASTGGIQAFFYAPQFDVLNFWNLLIKQQGDKLLQRQLTEVMLQIHIPKLVRYGRLLVAGAAQQILQFGHIAYTEEVAIDLDILQHAVHDIETNVDDAGRYPGVE